MKKLDKLILSSFIGPFILTFLVVVFILLNAQMLKYFDDIIGKDIGIIVLANLLFDFSIFTSPTAFPLAVLLSSLMTFGNLGEHFELTAIKSAGISLLRVITPIFIFVVGLTVFVFYFNNYFVPKAALNAYSLLYDIKQKKPTLDLKEGAFYNGIPDFSIKVNEKNSESGEIWEVIIYDHRDRNGNKKVTLADSGRMYTVLNDQYLILELYDGHSYIEGQSNAKTVSSKNARSNAESLSRVQFDKSKIVLDLSSFDLKRTKKELFSGNRIMRNLYELTNDIDSLHQDALEHQLAAFKTTRSSLSYLSKERLFLSNELENLEALKDSISIAKMKRRNEEFIREDSALSAIDNNKKSINEKKVIQPSKILKRAVSETEQKKLKKELINIDPISHVIANRNNRVEKVPSITSQIKKNIKTIDIQSKKLQTTKTDVNKEVVEKVEKKKDERIDEERMKRLATFISTHEVDKKDLESTINRVRQMKSKIHNKAGRIEKTDLDRYVFEVQWNKIISNSFACLVMFLIGAPLGAIIKKGGLGIPVLISIFFFIIFYVLGIVGDKQAKVGAIDPILGAWASNIVLLPVGLFLLRQARNDVKLFDADFYNVTLDNIKTKLKRK